MIKKPSIILLILLLLLPQSLFAIGPQGSAIGSQVEISRINGRIAAETIKNGAGDILRINVYGDSAIKPDEGNASLAGTMAWAEAQFPGDGPAYIRAIGRDFHVITPIVTVRTGFVLECDPGSHPYDVASARFGIQAKANINPMLTIGSSGTNHSAYRIKNCHFDGNNDDSVTAGGLLLMNMNAGLIEDSSFSYFAERAVVYDCTSTLNFCGWNKTRNTWHQENGKAHVAVIGEEQNDSHWVDNIFRGLSGGSAGNVEAGFYAEKIGGGVFRNNHYTLPNHLGCFHTTALSGSQLHVDGDIYDSCAGTFYAQFNNENSTFQNMTGMNAVTSSAYDGIVINGDQNNITNIEFFDFSGTASLRNGVVLSGDLNAVDFVSCRRHSGACVLLDHGSTNTQAGRVTIGNDGITSGVDFVNAGSSTNLRVTAPTIALTNGVGEDSFTEASDTAVASHTPEDGTGWTKTLDGSSGTSTATVIGADDHLKVDVRTTNQADIYTIDDAPSDADYSVGFKIVQFDFSLSDTIWVIGRLTATNTYYACGGSGWDTPGPAFHLYKNVAGTQTQLDTIGGDENPIAPGSVLKLEMIGSSIKCYHNGIEMLSATDSAITATGKGGIGYGEVAINNDDISVDWEIDNFSISD